MNNNQQPTEKIIQYLDGDLTGEELKDFEIMMTESTEIQEELKNLMLAKKAIQYYGLKSQVASVHHNMMDELKMDNQGSSERRIYPFIRNTLKIAASLFIIGIAFGAYQYVTITPSKLYQENYQPYKVSVSRGETSASNLEKTYINGDLNQTISVFEKLGKPGIKDYFLGAQAYMATHQPLKAIGGFNKILLNNSPDNTFKDDAEYYLAESYLENNEPLKAKPILEKIYADSDHMYHDQVSYWTLLKLRILILKAPGK
jgi:tetratricopeptide (TPR) repeat protein